MEAVEFMNAFRARVSPEEPSMVAWWKKQTTTVLSSIKPQPSVADVQTFVDIAISEGLSFFSRT
jgi:hypothetical protein